MDDFITSCMSLQIDDYSTQITGDTLGDLYKYGCILLKTDFKWYQSHINLCNEILIRMILY